MTSRRTVAGEKSPLDKDAQNVAAPKIVDPKRAPEVPADVVFKLLFFTAAMIGAPIGTYFLMFHVIYPGSATLAGATAAIMANVVLVGYVIVAMREDQDDRKVEAALGKKAE